MQRVLIGLALALFVIALPPVAGRNPFISH
jgi:hypothetical protein